MPIMNMNEENYELVYSDHDLNKVFTLPRWKGRGLYFAWSQIHQRYGYIQADTGGSRIRFKEPYHSENRKPGAISLVGLQVLEGSYAVILAENCPYANRKEKKKVKKMDKRNVNYIGTDYEVVEVSYELNAIDGMSINTYTFKTSIKLKAGDTIVVEDTNGLSLCICISDSVPRDLTTETIKLFNKAKAWVVDIVSLGAQTKRREATERKKFIMDQLAERREAMEEVAIYKMLAESDPTAAKLLTELEQLN